MEKLEKYKNNLAEIVTAAWKALLATLRTQLILALLTFIILCIGFVMIDIKLWGLKALAITLVDMIPLLGSSIVMIPWAVAHLIWGSNDTAIGLLIIYVLVFIMRQVLDPIINGKSVGIKPIYTLISTVVCSIILGPWGLILGSVVAVIIKTILDIRQRNSRT